MVNLSIQCRFNMNLPFATKLIHSLVPVKWNAFSILQIKFQEIYKIDFRILLAFILLSIAVILLIIVLFSRNKKLREFIQKQEKEKNKRKKDQSIIKENSKFVSKANPFLEEFFENTSLAIILCNKEGNILKVNPAFTKMYQYTLDEFISERDINYFKTFKSLSSIQNALHQKKSISFPVERTKKNGNKIWVHCELCPLIENTQQVNHILFIESDIGVYKSAELEMIQQNEQIVFGKTKLELQHNTMVNKLKNFADSISYAQRIQNAILPSLQQYRKLFDEYFILYKPRDVVSGDFYWLYTKGDKIVLALADCTGHGVPGAFMSILGMNYLNEICGKLRTLRPDTILNLLREKVIDALHKGSTTEITNDGMDIGLLVINTKKQSYEFAGANNSILLIKDHQIEVVKGDKAPVGYHPKKDTPFTLIKGHIDPETNIYMYSDGYVDQFGWRSGKKFKSQQFKQLLLDIQDIPLSGQKIILENTIQNWKGDLEQLDDILVIGLKINEL